MDALVERNQEFQYVWSQTFCLDMTLQNWLPGFISRTVSISGFLNLQCTKTYKCLSHNFLVCELSLSISLNWEK